MNSHEREVKSKTIKCEIGKIASSGEDDPEEAETRGNTICIALFWRFSLLKGQTVFALRQRAELGPRSKSKKEVALKSSQRFCSYKICCTNNGIGSHRNLWVFPPPESEPLGQTRVL